jgi:N-acylglucosamine 2-epimerase/mannose-6-phosphate isomerase
VAGEQGRMTEPGHQFEWAWILAGCQRATGRDVASWVRGLVAFAERYGVDADGMTHAVVRDDGAVLDAGSRVWCNTERIQAAVALFELFGRDPRPVFEASGRILLQRFLSHVPRGTWIDQVSPDGTPSSDKIPASTLYHVVIAFAEMLRVEQAVARAFAP